jgi:hypothetical protein
MLSMIAFLRKAYRRPLSLFHNQSVLSAVSAGNESSIFKYCKEKRNHSLGKMEVRPTILKKEQFLLRGMKKVTLEVGSLSLAHNLLKQAANAQKNRAAILQYRRIAALFFFYDFEHDCCLSRL